MNKPLASGHENDQESPATAMPEDETLDLRDVPLLMEVEALIRAGKSWAADFSAKVDEVSIALFGITAAETEPAPPASDNFYNGSTFDQAAWSAAHDEREDLLADLWVPDADRASYDELIDWWAEEGVLICDENDVPLRCLSFFGRQLNAALYELVPGAKLTIDGTGKRSTQSADAWGASLAAEAAEFARRPRR